jgi:hypothetical protein
MTASTNELAKEHVNMELLILGGFKWMRKISKSFSMEREA